MGELPFRKKKIRAKLVRKIYSVRIWANEKKLGEYLTDWIRKAKIFSFAYQSAKGIDFYNGHVFFFLFLSFLLYI